jgi:hypothetical protein
MWFISDILDALVTLILFIGFLFFFSIWGVWATISYPINKLYEINRKLFSGRANKVTNSNATRL